MHKIDFYKENFEKGLATYTTKLEPILNSFSQKKITSLLDIGCGDGTFSEIIKKKFQIKNVYGIDIASSAVSLAKKRGVEAFCIDLDNKDLPFKDGSFEGVYCGEVIEHVYDTDHLLDEIYRVLKKEGILVLTTPNLSSWYNRVLLLFGFQPFFTDFSLKHSVGHFFQIEPTGHLMVGTLKAVKELLKIHKFKIMEEIGIGMSTDIGWGRKHPYLVRISNRIFSSPRFSSTILIKCKK